jgi:hypothetical protein
MLEIRPKLIHVSDEFDPRNHSRYFRPESCNFTGIDAWDFDVGFYQMTVSEDHPITWRINQFYTQLGLANKVCGFVDEISLTI